MSDRLAVLPQYLLPKQALTALAGSFARAQAGTFDATGVTHDVVYFGSCGGTCPTGSTTTHAAGVLDEIYIYDNGLVEIGRGGLSDYLGSSTSNYPFTALAGVDAFRRAPVTADLLLMSLAYGRRMHDPLRAHL